MQQYIIMWSEPVKTSADSLYSIEHAGLRGLVNSDSELCIFSQTLILNFEILIFFILTGIALIPNISLIVCFIRSQSAGVFGKQRYSFKQGCSFSSYDRQWMTWQIRTVLWHYSVTIYSGNHGNLLRWQSSTLSLDINKVCSQWTRTTLVHSRENGKKNIVFLSDFCALIIIILSAMGRDPCCPLLCCIDDVTMLVVMMSHYTWWCHITVVTILTSLVLEV